MARVLVGVKRVIDYAVKVNKIILKSPVAVALTFVSSGESEA